MAGNHTAAELKLAEDVIAGLKNGNSALACQALTAIFQPDEPLTEAKLSQLITVCRTKKADFFGMEVDVDYSMVNEQAEMQLFRNQQEMDFVGSITSKTPEQLLDFLKTKDTNNRLPALAAQRYPDLATAATLNGNGGTGAGSTAAAATATSTYFETDSASSDSGNSTELSEEDIDTRAAIFIYRRASGFQKMLARGDTEDVAKYLQSMSGNAIEIDAAGLDAVLTLAENSTSFEEFDEAFGEHFESGFGRELTEEHYQIFKNVRTSQNPTDMLALIALMGDPEDPESNTGLNKFSSRVHEDLQEQLAEGTDKYNPSIKKNADILAIINGTDAAAEAAESAVPAGEDSSAEPDGEENEEEEEISFMDDPQGWFMQKIEKISSFFSFAERAIDWLKSSANSTLQGIGNFFGNFLSSVMSFVGQFTGGLFGGNSNEPAADNNGTAPNAGQNFADATNQPASNSAPGYGAQQPSAPRDSLSAQQAVAAADTRVDTTTPAQPQAAPSETDNTPAPAPAAAPRNP